MKYFPLVWAGLWRKPTRTIFTLLSIVVAFVLFGILQGLDAQIAHVQDVSKLDRLFVDSRFGPAMPLAYREQIERVPGVRVVAPRSVLIGYWRDPKNFTAIVMSTPQFFAARTELNITKAELETLAHTRTGFVASSFFAKHYGWKVGDRVPITSNEARKDGGKTWMFDLVGIVDDRDNPGDSGYMVGNYDYLDQSRTTDAGTITRFLVRIDDPNRTAQICKRIDQLFANSAVATRSQPDKVDAQTNLNATFNIGVFTKSVVAAVFFSLLFVTANTMMQSVRERTAEFAVLRTMGYSDAGVFALVLAESGLISLVGAAIGICLAGLLMRFAMSQVDEFFSHMRLIVLVNGLGAALLVALLSGLLPAWRAKQLVIVDALARR